KGALDKKTVGSMAIPVSSIDLIFQGDKPYLPSMGPMVTVPAAEFYFINKPFAADEKSFRGYVERWFYPYGMPSGDHWYSRTANALEPAWFRRLQTGLTENFNDSAFANAANIRYQDLAYQWEQNHGRPLPQRMIPRYTKQAMSETKAYWMLRAASSFLSPVPVETRSPQQFYIDLARKYRTKYGLKADTKFYNDVGADYFRYFTESTKSTNGLAPTSAGAKGYLKNKDLIDMAPDLAGVLAGPKAGDGKFNYEVYQWQLRTRKGPGSTETMREVQSPAQRIEQGQVDRGWIEYNKLADAIDVEMRRRGLTSLNSSAASDLQVFKKQKVMQIIERNPAWQQAYNSRVDNTSKWLGEANAVAWDKRLDGRTDIQGLRAYLLSREKVQEVLFQRQAQGGSASLSAQTNADLAGAWNSYLSELTGKNLLFSEIYHRYLESDDLTAMVTN
ncbi:MAG TPA: hypothetical protein VFH56_02295, partial [Acidimicrobiales bacterium]|nr:hypothetical protein [Acidimicrobiales bacterium]